MKEREVREGAQVALTAVLPCNVSFTRGQERTVHFAIVGLPEVHIDLHALRISQKNTQMCHVPNFPEGTLSLPPQPTKEWRLTDNVLRAPRMQNHLHNARSWISPSRWGQRACFLSVQGYTGSDEAGGAEPALDASEVLQASPSIVLAEAGPRPGGGRVLSVAPLLGAAASVDSSHPKWLHVHVRPPARGLLKTVRVRHSFLTACLPPAVLMHTLNHALFTQEIKHGSCGHAWVGRRTVGYKKLPNSRKIC